MLALIALVLSQRQIQISACFNSPLRLKLLGPLAPTQFALAFLGALPRRALSIDQTSLQPAVSIYTPVPQERPVRPLFVNACPLHIGHHNLLLVNRTLGG